MANYYTDENGVFINKYGIGDKSVLSEIEYEVTTLKIAELQKNPIQGDFNQAHLEKIHKHLFENIYEWAGRSRDVQSAKIYMDEGRKCRTKFCHPDKFSDAFSDVSKFLVETDNLKKIDGRENFIDAFTNIQKQLNHIHPFPEGNGRSLQVLMKQLAKESGYDVDYSKVSRGDWNLANGRAAPEQMKFFGHEPIEKESNTQMLSAVFNKTISLEKKLSTPNDVQKANAQEKRLIMKDDVREKVRQGIAKKFEQVHEKTKKPPQGIER